jgi:hypothetical protein
VHEGPSVHRNAPILFSPAIINLFFDITLNNNVNPHDSVFNLKPLNTATVIDSWERIVTNEASAIYALLALKVVLFNEQGYPIVLAALVQADTRSFTQ